MATWVWRAGGFALFATVLSGCSYPSEGDIFLELQPRFASETGGVITVLDEVLYGEGWDDFVYADVRFSYSCPPTAQQVCFDLVDPVYEVSLQRTGRRWRLNTARLIDSTRPPRSSPPI